MRIKALEEIGRKFENQNLTENEISQLISLLYEYKDIFCSDHENLATSNIAERHKNLTNSTPIRQKQYLSSLQQQNVMEKYVDKLLKANILRLSTSAWNSPAIFVKKANFDVTKMDDPNQYRLCIDFRRISKVVRAEFQPLTSAETV